MLNIRGIKVSKRKQTIARTSGVERSRIRKRGGSLRFPVNPIAVYHARYSSVLSNFKFERVSKARN